MSKEKVLDDKLRQMLRDLGKALSEAITESSEVNEALRRIHEEGYALCILLNRRPEGAGDEPERATTGAQGQPVFRINGGDLSFLRSIGIDPTRRVRRRRPTPSQPS